MKTDYCIVITTVDDAKTAAGITQSLLEKKLAACIQQTRIKSHYRWKGAIEEAEEIRLEIKTRSDLFEEIEKTILSLHSYDLPEIIMIPVNKGHAAYLAWVSEETRS